MAILDQALDRLVVFDAPGLDEDIECRERILLGLRHPDLLERPLGFRLLALRQLVQHVGGLVHPATLAASLGPHFLDACQKPSAPSATASSGAAASPRLFRSRSSSFHDCAFSRIP